MTARWSAGGSRAACLFPGCAWDRSAGSAQCLDDGLGAKKCQAGLANGKDCNFDWDCNSGACAALDGGAGLVFTEASAVTPEGGISPQDLGIWKDEHVEPLARIARFIEAQGATAGMQLAHSGRKASTQQPWKGSRVLAPGEDGGFRPILAPSRIPFRPEDPVPEELDARGIARIVRAFGDDVESFETRWKEFALAAKPSAFVSAMEKIEFLAEGAVIVSEADASIGSDVAKCNFLCRGERGQP